jgi:hypothetical protein
MRELYDYRHADVDAPIEVLLRSEEWRLLVRFAEGWFRQPISEASGTASSELAALGRKFGAPIPAALREWFPMFGAHESTLHDTNQDYVMPVERVAESPRWLMLSGENQGGWYCGLLREDCRIPDPPVYLEALGFDLIEDAGRKPNELVDGRFLRVSSRLTEFLFGMTLRQLLTGHDPSSFMRPGVCAASFVADWVPDLIRQRRATRLVLDLPAGFSPEFDGSDVVMIPELLLLARTPETFEEIWQLVKSSRASFTPEWFA